TAVNYQNGGQIRALDLRGKGEVPVDRQAVACREGERLHRHQRVVVEFGPVVEQERRALGDAVPRVELDRAGVAVERDQPGRVVVIAVADPQIAVVELLKRFDV